MPDAQRKLAAKKFVQRWQAAEGNEQREANSFWIELCHDLLGIPDPTHVLEFERKVRGRRIDVFYEDRGILVENKSRGVDLDKRYERGTHEGGAARMVTPYEQAKWYADNLPNTVRPRWVVVCNFDTIRIHDLNLENPASDYVEIRLEDLPQKLYLLSFFTDKSASRLEEEKDLSVRAGYLVGRIYDALSAQYANIETDPREQRSLNMLVTRLVFLLYAEDAGLLQRKNAFLDFMRKVEPEDMRGELMALFRVLDTPIEERDPYLKESLAAFPYVNGGLFAEEGIVIPQFTQDIKHAVLGEGSQGFDWSRISPTIFGAAFESTLNPETRRAGGMHYTSVENIHKVIDPLFLDDLKAELAEIEGERTVLALKQRLRAFQLKISRLQFLDPAMGSGNFLTETYLSLRRLELRVIEDLVGTDAGTTGGQSTFGVEVDNAIMVSTDQFHGIEINDFAVSVAKTALWIAERQMMARTQELLPFQHFDFLPLRDIGGLAEGNALRMDWNDVLPAERCSYVIGNPPFLGYSNQTPSQKEDLLSVWTGPNGKPVRGAGKLDYVSGWYVEAARYIAGTPIRCAFVSTNSICQGEQVSRIWKPIYHLGIRIDFAYDTFRWRNEANDQAHVFVVIVGFSNSVRSVAGKEKRLFHHASPDAEAVLLEAPNINAYLSPAPDAFVEPLSKPLCNAPIMTTGNRPADGGNLIIEDADLNGFLAQDPAARKFVRPLLGSREFINGLSRWCLWLVGAELDEIAQHPGVAARVEACRQDRLAAPDAGRRKLAESPALFREQLESAHDYLVVPEVSSERRRFVPIGYVPAETICTNLVFIVPDGGLYEFGVLASTFHNAWMRTVCGRLKSDYRYSQKLVYNTFAWPGAVRPDGAIDGETPVGQLVPEDVRARIEQTAQGILDARAAHPGATLAQLYDPDAMPADLRAAHDANDAAVEAAFGVRFGGDEEKIVAHLFGLYAKLAKGL